MSAGADMLLAHAVGDTTMCFHESVLCRATVLAHILFEGTTNLGHGYRLLVLLTPMSDTDGDTEFDYDDNWRDGKFRSIGYFVTTEDGHTHFVGTATYGMSTSTVVRNKEGGVYHIIMGSAE